MLFSKKPIFNKKGDIEFYQVNVGKESFFSKNSSASEDENQSFLSIIDDENNLQFFNNKPLIIPFNKDELDLLFSINKENRVVSFSMKEVDLETVKKIKKNGFELLLEDYEFEQELINYLNEVDYMVIDSLVYSNDYIKKIVDKFSQLNVEFIIDKIDSWERFNEIKEIDVDYFSGNYFAKPSLVELKSESVNKLSFIKLFNEINSPDIKFKNLSNIIKSDPTLTFSLLKKINSAFYGLKNNITSIDVAISLLGLDEIKIWISILSSKKLVSDKPMEILVLSLSRALFMEELSKKTDKQDSFNYYLTGFLSTIDAILNIEMKQAVEEIMVDERVKSALLGEENIFKTYLDTVKNIEKGNWVELELFLIEYDLDVSLLRNIYVEANKKAISMLS